MDYIHDRIAKFLVSYYVCLSCTSGAGSARCTNRTGGTCRPHLALRSLWTCCTHGTRCSGRAGSPGRTGHALRSLRTGRTHWTRWPLKPHRACRPHITAAAAAGAAAVTAVAVYFCLIKFVLVVTHGCPPKDILRQNASGHYMYYLS